MARQGINDVVSGRGPGVVAVFFGFERTNELFEWCRVRSAGGPRLVLDGHVIPGSEGRGLRQFLADLAQLLTEVSPTGQVVGDFCERSNYRVAQGLLWENGLLEVRNNIYQVFPGAKSIRFDLCAVTSGLMADLWEHLV